MKFEYTKHQTPRGSMPDAVVGDNLYLMKNVSSLHLTYQIRMLCYIATTQQKKLVIRIPKAATIHSTLKDFLRVNAKFVKTERV